MEKSAAWDSLAYRRLRASSAMVALTCTDSCPTHPFSVHAGLGERLWFVTYTIPEMELFREFMNSIARAVSLTPGGTRNSGKRTCQGQIEDQRMTKRPLLFAVDDVGNQDAGGSDTGQEAADKSDRGD